MMAVTGQASGRQMSRHQAISGTAAAPEKKGLNLTVVSWPEMRIAVIVSSLTHPADARHAPDVRSA
jgi:hypothetical protein